MISTKNLVGASIAAAMSLAILPSNAVAIPIDAALSISGTINGNAQSVNANNTYTESLYSTVGGATSGGTVSSVNLTDTGDGWGHNANLSGDSSSTNTLYSLYDISAINSSVDNYELTFGITYDHTADANAGDLDARAISRLSAGIPAGDGGTTTEYLNLELESESGDDYAATHPTWQDRVNKTYVGTNGAVLNQAATTYFTINLLAGTTFNLEAEYLLSGRTFDSGANFSINNNMFIFLDDFKNLTGGPIGVPEPGTLSLLMAGLLAIRFGRKKYRAITH